MSTDRQKLFIDQALVALNLEKRVDVFVRGLSAPISEISDIAAVDDAIAITKSGAEYLLAADAIIGIGVIDPG